MPKLKRKCPVCQTRFTPIRHNHKYCSIPCRDKINTYKRADQEQRLCGICGTAFTTVVGSNKKFCCQECSKVAESLRQRSGKNPWVRQNRKCKTCGKEFLASNSVHTYCSNSCSSHQPKPRQHLPLKKILKGSYVYAWYLKDEILPFYIGKGEGRRAWAPHHGAFCETIRRAGGGAGVEIVRDGLTDEGAKLVESVLINFVKSCGGLLTNQNQGKRCLAEPAQLKIVGIS